MARHRLSAQARTDLRESLRYVAENSGIQNARRLRQQIQQRFLLLGGQPFAGRSRPELGAELRSFPVSSFVIIYRPTDYGVEIVRVVHGRRDIESMFPS